jgi:hypothetical protein
MFILSVTIALALYSSHPFIDDEPLLYRRASSQGILRTAYDVIYMKHCMLRN